MCFYRWGDFRGRGLSYIRGELQISEETACKLATAIAFVIAGQVLRFCAKMKRKWRTSNNRAARFTGSMKSPGIKPGNLASGLGLLGPPICPDDA